MNIVETVTAMRRTYEHGFGPRFSDPAQTGTLGRRGREETMLTHGGTTSSSWWSRARYCDGVSPTISLKRELNEPSDVQPTATHESVTDIPCRRSAFARSMRRVIK